jgi:GTPase SAR1 family protein
MLVGNKSDLTQERRVDVSEGRELAQQYNIPFMEVSAKENINISEVFMTLGKGIKEKLMREE